MTNRFEMANQQQSGRYGTKFGNQNQGAQNPLRISQSEIDIDDIISDLHD